MTTPDWQDGKRYLWPLGLLVPLIPFGAWLGVHLTGSPVFWWVGPILVFVVFPLVDTIVGQDTDNPPEAAIPGLEADRYYRWCTYLYLPLQYVSLVLACWLWTRPELGVVDRVGLAVSVGCVSGIAINTAHELGHKREDLERWLSRIALAQTGYGHFYVEHNRGHHVRVATPEDPASSRLGESFWAFLPRSVAGSARSAWKLEFARLRRGGGNPWTWRNDVLTSWAMTLALFAALTVAFGPAILPYLLLQAVFGFSLLEVVNYLEHYGLARQREHTGRYEKVRPAHSWNSNQVPSNLLLFHLQRHSDHHTYPTRRYQSLRHFEEAPQLPSGYPLMIILAWVTPLWRRVMDPRVLAHYDGDLSLTNRGPQ
ncbi:alkane 1-monooxygenase [Longispora sp. K20-0274]|uniref:alkane 1-monooxygenase n=1 Tax=Longispora sp. K20-0274 TaxID=3088255 RepID=UPI00399B7834